MTRPKSWERDLSPDDFRREVMDAASEFNPPKEAKSAAWAALLIQVAALPPVPPVPPTPPVVPPTIPPVPPVLPPVPPVAPVVPTIAAKIAAITSQTVVKATIVGLLGTSSVAGGYYLHNSKQNQDVTIKQAALSTKQQPPLVAQPHAAHVANPHAAPTPTTPAETASSSPETPPLPAPKAEPTPTSKRNPLPLVAGKTNEEVPAVPESGSPTTAKKNAQGTTGEQPKILDNSNTYPVTTATTATPPSKPATVATRLKEESLWVARVRSALQAGNAGQALALLNQIQAKFGNGLMYQEREALTIRALWNLGQRDLARSRARAFIKHFPRSPYNGSFQSMLQ
jgi:hypothetical protein